MTFTMNEMVGWQFGGFGVESLKDRSVAMYGAIWNTDDKYEGYIYDWARVYVNKCGIILERQLIYDVLKERELKTVVTRKLNGPEHNKNICLGMGVVGRIWLEVGDQVGLAW